MKPLVIFGASHFAELACFYFTKDSQRQVAAYCVDAPYLKEATKGGIPVVASDELLRDFPPDRHAMFVALGNNLARAEKFESVSLQGYELVSYVSSRATLWPDLTYGPNTFITEGTMIMPFVTLGRNIAIWAADIGHHSTIGDHCSISGATLSGGVSVGERTFIGVNASIKERIRIGKRNIIGAGAVILKSTNDDAVHAVHHTRASRVPSSRLKSI